LGFPFTPRVAAIGIVVAVSVAEEITNFVTQRQSFNVNVVAHRCVGVGRRSLFFFASVQAFEGIGVEPEY